MIEVGPRSPFPFLIGSGRSGTTLLRLMVNSHPEMAIPPEAFFPLDPPEAWLDPSGELDAGRAALALQDERWMRDWGLAPGAFPSAVAAVPVAGYADLLRCLYHAYADEQCKPRYGSKTPQHVLAMPELSVLFPESRFVHIIRDGRDVAMSFLDVHFGPTDLAWAARLWKKRVTRGRETGRALGADRYLELHYEVLVDDPETQLRRVCGFCDLTFDDAMVRYHERDVGDVAGVGVYYHANAVRPPTKGLRDWQTQMSRSDLLLFESIAGPTLEVFGYQREGRSASQSERVLVRARKAASDARRRMRSLRKVPGLAARRLRRA